MVQKAPKYKKPTLIPYSPIVYHFFLLSTKQKIRVSVLLAVSIITGLLGIFSPIDFIWYISFFAFALGIIDLYSTYFLKKELNITKSREVSKLCSNLTPSFKEKEYGYKTIPLPDNNDSILMSYDVNSYLRSDEGRSISLNFLPNQSNEIIRKHASKSELFKDVLIHQHFKSRQKKNMFFNDKKISLKSTLKSGLNKVDVYESCYYLSFLTNDLATFNIEDFSNEAEPEEIWAGIENFPYTEGNKSAPNRMKELEVSNMSNHIGGNTIAFTSNGKMVLWRQGKSALRSIGLLAPTGSGSLDFSDYLELENKNILDLAIKGMERELLEESHPVGKEITNFIHKTKLIGYYRWLGKAGLPGFLGVTKLNVDEDSIFPCVAEVDNPSKTKTVYLAENLEQLNDSISELESMATLSVPLKANLLALKETIMTEPDSIKFLFELNSSSKCNTQS